MSDTLAPGLLFCNNSEIPVLVILSQLSPLHWKKVMPGETSQVACGRVFFTVSVEPWIEGKEPTQLEVAGRIGAVIASGAVFGFVGFAVTGLLSGVTSFKGVRKSGVYADGRTVFIKGTTVADTGVFQLFIESVEPIVTLTKRTKLRKIDGKMTVYIQ